jgi:hypothetical protein
VIALPKLSSAISTEMLVQMAPLCEMRRTCVRVADIAFDANGSVLVATSDGTVGSAVQCSRVMLRHNDMTQCHISCTAMSSFYPDCHTESVFRDSTTARVTHVRFVRRDTGYALLVGAGDINGSRVELWQLASRSVNIHRFFQSPDSTTPTTFQVQLGHISSFVVILLAFRCILLFGDNGVK